MRRDKGISSRLCGGVRYISHVLYDDDDHDDAKWMQCMVLCTITFTKYVCIQNNFEAWKWMGGGRERHKKAKNKIKGDVQWRQCNVPRFLYLLQL